jgi:predicted NAD/FAD-binding protein
MPVTRRCWSSWNYRIGHDTGGAPAPATVYWINSLQNLPTRRNYFVLNQRGSRVHFCGSYFRYGFHEDALKSALDLSRLLGADAWN